MDRGCDWYPNGTRWIDQLIASYVVYDVMDIPGSYASLFDNFTAANETLYDAASLYNFGKNNSAYLSMMVGLNKTTTPYWQNPVPKVTHWATSTNVVAPEAMPFRDYTFDAAAGTYVSAFAFTPLDYYGGGAYIELIAPGDDGSASDPDDLNTAASGTSVVPPPGFVDFDSI